MVVSYLVVFYGLVVGGWPVRDRVCVCVYMCVCLRCMDRQAGR